MPTRPLLTRAELVRYQDRLRELQRVRDIDLPDLRRAARELVASDAVEEMAQMQDDFALVEARIARIEGILRDARVVDDDDHDADCVVPGRTVTLRYVGSGKEARYVVGVEPGGDGLRAVSVRSPVGQAIVGRCVGDLVTVELPDGRTEELLIVSVSAVAPC